MEGDLAPLPELVELADRFEAMLLVDEAHATGVWGAAGRGVAEHWGVAERVAVRVGTLSKALGSLGGFVAGSAALVDWLANRARSYVYSTAPPEPLSAAAGQALRVVRAEPQRRRELLERAAGLRERLRQRGWELGPSCSQIIPLRVGEVEAAMRLARRLHRAGLFVPAIRPPSVPEGQSLLRISLTWSHSAEMVERLLEALGPGGHS
jgi:8-amino-7-oxononanoate synthase